MRFADTNRKAFRPGVGQISASALSSWSQYQCKQPAAGLQVGHGFFLPPLSRPARNTASNAAVCYLSYGRHRG